MKNFRFFILFLIAGLIQSCDQLNDITTVDLNGNIRQSYNVNITAEDPTTVAEVFTVDASDNAEMAKYLEKIEKYTIKSISYVIKNYSGAAGITFTGNMNFGSITTDITNLDLQAASTESTVFNVDIDQAALDAISADLLDGNSISGEFEGTVSDKPVSFTIDMTFNVDFRAGVID
jgi:hypothetical protein